MYNLIKNKSVHVRHLCMFFFFLNNLQKKIYVKERNTNKVSIYCKVLKDERNDVNSLENKTEYYKQRIIYSAISKNKHFLIDLCIYSFQVTLTCQALGHNIQYFISTCLSCVVSNFTVIII